MQFSLKCSPRPYLFACQVWLRNSKGVPLIWGLNLELSGFWFRDAISWKRCKIELRRQLITNRKSYVGFWFQQKSMTLNGNLQLCHLRCAYIDQTTEARIMQFSLKCSPRPYLFACQVWLQNSKGVPLIGGLNLEWGGFWIRDAISRKWCEIKLRWQLIINRKSYMGFRLQQKLMTLNVNSLLCHQSYACFDQMAEARITRYFAIRL